MLRKCKKHNKRYEKYMCSTQNEDDSFDYKILSPKAQALRSFTVRRTVEPACPSVLKQETVCVSLVRLLERLARFDSWNRSGRPPTWHQSVGKALTQANTLLIDWSHTHSRKKTSPHWNLTTQSVTDGCGREIKKCYCARNHTSFAKHTA